ncbi:MAG: TspO/MBR family protein [Bacteroidota bacterium]
MSLFRDELKRRPGFAIGSLIVFVLVCQAAGGIGAVATAESVETWYQTLDKPAFTPPGWLFGPVWTLLYALMGIAAWRVWMQLRRQPGNRVGRTALGVFAAQLAVNTSWSFVFFGQQQVLPALVVIGVLWVLIAVTMALFFRMDRLAGWLLVPYLLWVSYATAVNAGVWVLN